MKGYKLSWTIQRTTYFTLKYHNTELSTVRYTQVVLKAMASGKQWKEEVSNAAYAPFVFIQQTQSNKTSMEIITSHNTLLTKYLLYTLNWLHYFFFYFTFVYFKNKVPRTTCSTLVYHQCCAYHRLKTTYADCAFVDAFTKSVLQYCWCIHCYNMYH